MTRDSDMHRAAIQLEPPADDREQTDAEKYRELVAAHNMQQNLLAIEMRLTHQTITKQGKTHDKMRDLLVEMRDAQRDLAKPDPVQQSILDEQRAIRELLRDVAESLATLVSLKLNGHAH